MVCSNGGLWLWLKAVGCGNVVVQRTYEFLFCAAHVTYITRALAFHSL